MLCSPNGIHLVVVAVVESVPTFVDVPVGEGRAD